MASRAIGIAGDSPAAHAYAMGARALGWDVTHSAADIVVPAPMAASLEQADSLIAAGGRRAFGWPLISTMPVQELLRRVPSVGTITSLSSRSTRPRPPEYASLPGGVLVQSAHDHIALTLLTALVAGMGAPCSVSATATRTAGGPEHSVDLDVQFDGGLTASVHADWQSSTVVSSEFQLAGTLGVLRSETDPRPALEFSGDAVPLRPARVRDEQHRPLHESGVIDMLTSIAAGFDDGALPHAFTLAFGREVLDVILSGYRSFATGGPITLPWTGDRTATPGDILAG